MDWITGLNKALDYIENHITEKLNYEEIANKCFYSRYHFQRVFSILSGYTLGDYIRYRRLTLAGKDIKLSNMKVIDVALKYGYESPDSFTKAFVKFHGITPTEASKPDAVLRSFSPLKIKILLSGGSTMEYRIEKKQELKLLGYKRHFEGVPFGEQRNKQEEKIFMETRAYQWMLRGISNDMYTDYCVITDIGDFGYDFYMAVTADDYELDNLYNFDVTGIDFMDKFNFGKLIIPEATYAIFVTEKSNSPVDEYLDIRERIISEWLPNSGYQLAEAPELSLYHWRPIEDKKNRYIEIWIPIVKINK